MPGNYLTNDGHGLVQIFNVCLFKAGWSGWSEMKQVLTFFRIVAPMFDLTF